MRFRQKFSRLQFSLAGLLLLVAWCAVLMGWLRPWEPEWSVERNWSRLELGMTETEVEKLIGEPQFALQDDQHVVYYYWQCSLASGKALEFESGQVARICDDLEFAEPVDGWSNHTLNLTTGRSRETW